jgi:bifunctional UDP-N-acetylglucosamine pyrophosphorylase/glucosamine-1-phosphate N-acetyltransferase
MKRKAVVLLLGGEKGAGRGRAGGKLFVPLLGRPLGAYALEAVCGLGPDAVLVLAGAGGAEALEDWERLIKGVDTKTPAFLLADRARKGDRSGSEIAALITARAVLEKYPEHDILAVPAGLPLLRTPTLRAFLRAHASKGTSLTFMSRGREGGLSGLLAVRSADVFPLLRGIAARRGMAGFEVLARRLTKAGKSVGFFECPADEEVLPVRTAEDMSRTTRLLRERKNASLARKGVILLDPDSAWIDWAVEVGPRTTIYPAVVIEGETRIGADGRISPHVHIMNSRLGARVRVLSSTVMEDTALEDDAQVGPFSRLRPKTRVCSGAKVGNFVEMKNTLFGPRSKAQHLSYLGDSQVEEDVNVGAGTITCNYDGFSKNPTLIGAGAFIGSGAELVAPVKIGRKAYVAAGSTITRDVPAGVLAIARARQVEKPGWVLEKVRGRKKKGRGDTP